MNSPLFRSEAIESQRVNWLGEIVLVRPTSYAFLTAAACAMALVVVIFLFAGSYTKRASVIGQVVPEAGQARVYAPGSAIVSKRLVKEGQLVAKGQVLYVLTGERYGSDTSPIQEGISKLLKVRVMSLEEELRKLDFVQAEERRTNEHKVSSSTIGLDAINKQLESQRKMVKISEDVSQRYQGLVAKGIISRELAQQRVSNILQNEVQLKSLEMDRQSRQQQLAEATSSLASLASRQSSQRSEIERSLATTRQELAESEGKREIQIVAPEAGVATNVMAEPGHTIDGNRPLLNIVPEGSQMMVELYVPSNAIGFIAVDQVVRVRYQAYPYQKFGQYDGIVESISKTTMAANELQGFATQNGSEQFFRIRVQLKSQDVMAYGKPIPVQSGMMVDADVLQENRRLYEWVLEPLFSITGKI